MFVRETFFGLHMLTHFRKMLSRFPGFRTWLHEDDLDDDETGTWPQALLRSASAYPKATSRLFWWTRPPMLRQAVPDEEGIERITFFRSRLPEPDDSRENWATVYSTDKFLFLGTFSGYPGFSRPDPTKPTVDLPRDATNADLGRALLQVLANSLFTVPWRYPALFQDETADETDRRITADLMARYGYGSAREMFGSAAHCFVVMTGDGIEIQPFHNHGREVWSLLDQTLWVRTSYNAGNDDIGAALRLALSRCTQGVEPRSP